MKKNFLWHKCRQVFVYVLSVACVFCALPAWAGTITLKTTKKANQTIKLTIKASDKNVTLTGVTGKWKSGAATYKLTDDGGMVTVSGNITEFKCSGNRLISLELKECDVLTDLTFSNNDIEQIDLSQCTAIKRVTCANGKLKALNVGGSKTLISLYCNENQLETVDISNCPKLYVAYFFDNKLKSLNVKGCPTLGHLSCFNNNLTQLDISDNLALEELYCGNNHLETLDVANHKKLVSLYCYANNIKALDVKDHAELKELYCYLNRLEELDLTGVGQLMSLDCGDNSIKALDVSKCPNLTTLSCFNNGLHTLDISKNRYLNNLSCFGNNLTQLNLANNMALTGVSCGDNRLQELDVKGHKQLTGLSCEGNMLHKLDVTGCDALMVLNCSRNAIKGGNMEALIASLPDQSNNQLQKGADFMVYCDTATISHRNVCSVGNVADAAARGWIAKEYKINELLQGAWEVYTGVMTHKVTVKPLQGGTVNLLYADGGKLDGLDAVPHGTEVTLEVDNDQGKEIEQILLNGKNILPEMKFVVNQDVEIEVVWQVLSGLTSLDFDKETTIKAIYDCCGHRRNALEAGVNIVVLDNGKVNKVIMKR